MKGVIRWRRCWPNYSFYWDSNCEYKEVKNVRMIRSAPKDGTPILAIDLSGSGFPSKYEDGKWMHIAAASYDAKPWGTEPVFWTVLDEVFAEYPYAG